MKRLTVLLALITMVFPATAFSQVPFSKPAAVDLTPDFSIEDTGTVIEGVCFRN